MLVGYAKIGRTVDLDPGKWGVTGGDVDAPRLLDTLARRNPGDTFVIVSLCRDDPAKFGYPPNVVNAWTPERLQWMRDSLPDKGDGSTWSFEQIPTVIGVMDALVQPLAEKIDGLVVWAGQHGTANSILPAVTTGRSTVEGVTRPYDSFNIYAGPVLRLINTWRDRDPAENEEIWLIADARNYVKARDIKWPGLQPVLGQYDMKRNTHHERYGDACEPAECGFPDAVWKTDHTWGAKQSYVYSRLEVAGTLPQHTAIETAEEFAARDLRSEWVERRDFGLFINEAGATGANKRRDVVPEWVLPQDPTFVHGKWSSAGLKKIGREITPAPWEDYFPLTRSVRCTFTTPSSCSGWATMKPWESFGAGTVCFRHPVYDDQNHIYGSLPDEVREWLSPPTPADLAARIKAISQQVNTFEYLVRAQRALYDEACRELDVFRTIEQRYRREAQ